MMKGGDVLTIPIGINPYKRRPLTDKMKKER